MESGGARKNRKVVIVGGGLVGALNACFFSKRGWDVELYEARPDIRTSIHYPGRSINLALSLRGREALKAVDCEDAIMEHAIPMYGRYVHDKDGKTFNIQKYGIENEYICSISRRRLNEILLSHVENATTVRLHFRHKLKSYNKEKKMLIFLNLDQENAEVFVKGDLICGCDGAFSAVRRSFLQVPDFNYSQTYIEHRYLELCIEPDESKDFRMPPNYFHLWPRGNFCLIGLANQDKTFTVTLMAPKNLYDSFDTEEKFAEFFARYFPDAYRMIEKEQLLDVFRRQKPNTLLMIKSEPHHMEDNVVLLGDAAHAMVPFYGQGMNAGFEDCLVFHELLDKNGEDIGQTLRDYSAVRCIDSHAICDLAMYNYSELRDLVNHWSFRMRKYFDFTVYKLFPRQWMPMYNMVTFSRIRYHEVINERKRQDIIVKQLKQSLAIILVGTIISGFVWGLKKLSIDLYLF